MNRSILKLNQISFSFIDYLLWGMAFLWLIIDSITGFFISYGVDMPLSQLFKLLLLALVIVRLYKYKTVFLSFYLLLLYLAWYFLHLSLINVDFVSPILLFSKFLSLLFLYAYFRNCIFEFPSKTILYARNVMVIAWLVVAFNVTVGLMGYGIPSYGEDAEEMGVKGFFFAGNELGGIMAVLVPFIVYLVLMNLSGIKAILAYIVIILVGVLIGTKSSILVTLLSVIIVPILYMSLAKRLKILFGLAIITFVTFPFLANMFEEFSIGALDRWIYFYDTGGISRLIFSGRDDFWEFKKELFLNSGIMSQLFGIGAEGKFVERDHLDFLLIFGYAGLIFIVSFFLYLLVTAIRNRHNNSLVKVIIFSDGLVLGIGYMAGHVWFSAMASLYIALLNAFAFVHHDEMLFSKK